MSGIHRQEGQALLGNWVGEGAGSPSWLGLDAQESSESLNGKGLQVALLRPMVECDHYKGGEAW